MAEIFFHSLRVARLAFMKSFSRQQGWHLYLVQGPSLFEHLAASLSWLPAVPAYSYLADCLWTASGKEPGVEAKLMSLKIMVVDDEPLSQQLIRSLAAPSGHTVLTFEDSQEAGQRAETQRFDVTFVGMRTPQLDGLELARRIRNSPLNLETTIVMLSATDDVGTLRKAFGEGADFVLAKPVTAGRIRPMLAAMDSPGWKGKRHAARLPLFAEVVCTWDKQQFHLRSKNISESGMLLQPSLDLELGQEVGLEFKIAEVRASLNVLARIVRKEGTERVAVAFIGLAPEDHNAIQLYVMGRLVDLNPQRDLLDVGIRRMFIP
jgi:CheY-like chemotaxis protein